MKKRYLKLFALLGSAVLTLTPVSVQAAENGLYADEQNEDIGGVTTNHVIELNTDGGKLIDFPDGQNLITVANGEKAQKPKDPIKEGYTFTGWFYREDSGTRFDFNTPITQNISLVAHWERNTPYEVPIGDTQTVFEIDNNDIDIDKPDDVLGGDLIVSVPAELRLAYTSQGNQVYTKADTVYAVGRTHVSDILRVATDTNITYLADDATPALLAQYPEAEVPGTISFGDTVDNQQVTQWLASELREGVGKQSVTDGIGKGISSTVQKDDIKYLGSYSSTIWYNMTVDNSAGNQEQLVEDTYFKTEFWGQSTLNDVKMTAQISGLTAEGLEWLHTAASNNNVYGEKEKDTLIIPAKIVKDGKEYTVISVLKSAFSGYTYYTNFEKVIMADTVTSIGSDAFNLSSIKSIKLSNKLENIDETAFLQCKALESIYLPDSLKNIGYGAFQQCTSLESVSIPNGTLSIDNDAFSRCTALTTVYYRGTEEERNANLTIGTGNDNLLNAHWEYITE